MTDAATYEVADHVRRLEEHSEFPGFFAGFAEHPLIKGVDEIDDFSALVVTGVEGQRLLAVNFVGSTMGESSDNLCAQGHEVFREQMGRLPRRRMVDDKGRREGLFDLADQREQVRRRAFQRLGKPFQGETALAPGMLRLRIDERGDLLVILMMLSIFRNRAPLIKL